MKDFNDFNFGVIAATLYALNEQAEKRDGYGTIQAMASYYRDNARMAIDGKKEDRENAVGFFLNALHNIAALLYNNGIDIDDFRKTCDRFKDKWDGKDADDE